MIKKLGALLKKILQDMDMSDDNAAKKRDCESNVRNFDLANTPVDWRISDSNPIVSYPPENPMSTCQAPSQMMDSFRQNLWHDDGGFTVHHHTDAGTSNSNPSSFRGNIDGHLEMGWNMAQFPADSGFVERAAKLSFFGCGSSFGEMMMMNQDSLGVPESSVGLFLQDTQIASGNGSVKVVKDRSNGLSNVSEDSKSSGGTSSKRLSSKKRKRTGKDTEPDQSHSAQQSGEEQGDTKQKDEQSPNSNANKTNSGYIHMRARRGQATNSHSLAERVRREKISERMKFLQDLVPGCDKVTGKAVMLDEIINYVQSLQCQIEFLSMKLSAVNPVVDFNFESLLAKDAALQSSAPTFPQNLSTLYPPLSYMSQAGFMQPNLSSMSLLNGGLKRQETHGYENDHHNVVHLNQGSVTAPDPDPVDTTGEDNLKVEP